MPRRHFRTMESPSAQTVERSVDGRTFIIAGTNRHLFLPHSIEAKIGETITILGVECVVITACSLRPTSKPFPDSWFVEI